MEESHVMQEMTSRDYIRVLFRQKAVILTTILTVMATVVIAVMMQTPVYQAEVKMLISGQKQAQADYYTGIAIGGMRTDQMTQTQTEIVTSDPVIERAVAVLGLAKKSFDYEKKFSSPVKKPFIELRARSIEKKFEKMPQEQKEAFMFRLAMEDLRNQIDVTPVRETNLFLIKVKEFNPLGAAVMANVVSRSYIIFDLEQQLAEMKLKYGEKNLAVIQLKEAIEKMSNNLSGAPLSPIDAIGPATIKIIEQAKVPLKPTGISRTLMIILAFFVSIFLSLMVGFGFEYVDQSFKSPREVESTLGISYLGSLPVKVKKEDYVNLSEQLYMTMRERGVKSVLFASAMPQEGVTPIIANLGLYISEQLHKKVLLIDGNLRHPVLHKMFKLPESKNLMNVFEGKLTLEKGVKAVNQNLDVLTSGPSPLNPVMLLESDMMKLMIQQARNNYDVVLIDSSPLREFKDTTKFSVLTDGVVIIVNEKKTRRPVIKNVLDPLKARKVNLLGVVLTDRKFSIPKMIYDMV